MTCTRRKFCLWPFATMAYGAFLQLLGCGDEERAKEPARLETIAFGSCNKQEALQSHWSVIAQKNPQGWVWMGDCIYADEATGMERKREYRRLKSNPEYRDFERSGFMLGTWDDHDYATNDAGEEFAGKDLSQKLFLDFIGESDASVRRTRRGIYDSRFIGEDAHAVQFLLLDLRYFKPKPAKDADPLGPEQWAWLEQEVLREGPALKVLVSSLQVLTDFTQKETWGAYPEAQKRLLALLARSPVQVLVFSGDRHLSEIAAIEVGPLKVVHEMTASGLTHSTHLTNDNPFRIGQQINETNFGFMQLEWAAEQNQIVSIHLSSFSPQSGLLLQDLRIPYRWG